MGPSKLQLGLRGVPEGRPARQALRLWGSDGSHRLSTQGSAQTRHAGLEGHCCRHCSGEGTVPGARTAPDDRSGPRTDQAEVLKGARPAVRFSVANEASVVHAHAVVARLNSRRRQPRTFSHLSERFNE